jgi:hypothetical protein
MIVSVLKLFTIYILIQIGSTYMFIIAEMANKKEHNLLLLIHL